MNYKDIDINDNDKHIPARTDKETCRLIDDYTLKLGRQLKSGDCASAKSRIKSEAFFEERMRSETRPSAKAGDIVFLEFGQTFDRECGGEHYALVISTYYGKVFVVPMTSNQETYSHAYDEVTCPHGRRNLMAIGQPKGMSKNSVLFLNDAKFISTARIIKVASAVDKDLLDKVKDRLSGVLRGEDGSNQQNKNAKMAKGENG